MASEVIFLVEESPEGGYEVRALGPVTGKLIAECILDGAPSLDITGLDPERF